MLFSLSLRYKLPLWGSALIVVTALILSASFMAQAWEDLRHDLLRSSQDLGQTMARSLFPILLHDDVWRAFETVSLPFQERVEPDDAHPESLLVLDRQNRVYVSSHPERFPVLAELAALGPEFRDLGQALPLAGSVAPLLREAVDSPSLFIAIPIAEDEVQLGTLVVIHRRSALWPRFVRIAERAIGITLLVLAVLLPINWYWGGRMTKPLTLIASRMGRIGRGPPEPVDAGVYPYRDELGELFKAYGKMIEELHAKESLEQEVLRSERMAAVGRLTSGIAHEINNPLGGMLNAISTFRRHGADDPALTLKTISLIERGLQQIRETVGALLVEAKLQNRALTPEDIEDIRHLLAPEAHKRRVDVVWEVSLPDLLPLPATLVRQVLINLLLNAMQAAGQDGRITIRLTQEAAQLRIEVENNGRQLSQEQMATLFEPFLPAAGNARGIGLWICYQIVSQLRGDIRAEIAGDLTRFVVTLPTESRDDTLAA